MPRPKKIKDQVRLSFVVSKAQAKAIEDRVRHLSNQEDKIFTISEVLRELVSIAIPVPKNQPELF